MTTIAHLFHPWSIVLIILSFVALVIWFIPGLRGGPPERLFSLSAIAVGTLLLSALILFAPRIYGMTVAAKTSFCLYFSRHLLTSLVYTILAVVSILTALRRFKPQFYSRLNCRPILATIVVGLWPVKWIRSNAAR